MTGAFLVAEALGAFCTLQRCKNRRDASDEHGGETRTPVHRLVATHIPGQQDDEGRSGTTIVRMVLTQPVAPLPGWRDMEVILARTPSISLAASLASSISKCLVRTSWQWHEHLPMWQLFVPAARCNGVKKCCDALWDLRGGAAPTSSAFNLNGDCVVNGDCVAYDIDLTNADGGVNASIYTVSPTFFSMPYVSNTLHYCHGATSGDDWCRETDWIEASGYCGGAATTHTIEDSCGLNTMRTAFGPSQEMARSLLNTAPSRPDMIRNSRFLFSASVCTLSCLSMTAMSMEIVRSVVTRPAEKKHATWLISALRLQFSLTALEVLLWLRCSVIFLRT